MSTSSTYDVSTKCRYIGVVSVVMDSIARHDVGQPLVPANYLYYSNYSYCGGNC